MAYSGKPLDAVKNQTSGFTISNHAEDEHNILGLLMANATDRIALRGFQKILYVSGSRFGVAEAVRTAIEKTWVPHSFAHAAKFETGIDVLILGELRSNGPPFLHTLTGGKASAPPGINAQGWSRMIDENGKLLLQEDLKIEAVADLPYPQAKPTITAADNGIVLDKNPADVIFTTLSSPCSTILEKQSEAEAHVMVTHAGAAVLAWKVKHDSYPSSLNDVFKNTHVDAYPFTQLPLGYKAEANGFVIYSVGKDGTIDGGEADQSPPKGAILFRYPFPAYDSGIQKEQY